MPRKLDTNYNVYSANLTEGNSPGRFNISEVGTSVIRLNKGDIAEIIIDNSVGPTDVSEFRKFRIDFFIVVFPFVLNCIVVNRLKIIHSHSLPNSQINCVLFLLLYVSPFTLYLQI
jgi:hypothetical protein